MMWKTKAVVYTLIFSLAMQPFAAGVSEANPKQDRPANSVPNSTPGSDDYQDETVLDGAEIGTTGTTTTTTTTAKKNVSGREVDVEALLKGIDSKTKKRLSHDEWVQTIVDLASPLVLAGCVMIDGKVVGAKGEGEDMKLVDDDGKVISDLNGKTLEAAPSAVSTDTGVLSYGRPLNCSEGVLLFNLAWAALEEAEQVAQTPKDGNPILADTENKAGDPSCADANCTNEALQKLTLPSVKGADKIETVTKQLSESDQEKIEKALSPEEQKVAACMASPNQGRNLASAVTKTVGCTADWVKGLFTPPAKGMGPAAWVANFTKKVATDAGGCLGELLGATIKSVWGLLKGVFYELPKAAWELSKTGVRKLTNWVGLTKAESVSSDKTRLASQTTAKEVEAYKKNWFDYIVTGMKHVVNFFLGEVTHEIGCEKWAGLPYASACEKPWKGWECATCGQVKSIVCGGAGAVVGSVLSAGVIGKVFRGVGGLAKGLFTRAPLQARAARGLTEAVQGVKSTQNGLLAASTAGNTVVKGSSRAMRVGRSIRNFVTNPLRSPARAAKATAAELQYSAKAAKRFARMKKNPLFKGLAKAGQGIMWAANKAKWVAKGVEQKIVSPLEKFAVPKYLVIKPMKGAHSLVKDYFYTVNRAFEGRMIAPWNIRSARLADKMARQAAAAGKNMTLAAAVKQVDDVITKQQEAFMSKAVEMGGERSASSLKAQLVNVGTENYVKGIDGLSDLDRIHHYALQKAERTRITNELKSLEGKARTKTKTAQLQKQLQKVEKELAEYEAQKHELTNSAFQALKAQVGEAEARSLLQKAQLDDLSKGAIIAEPTGVQAVDDLNDFRKAVHAEKARLEKALDDAKASGNKAAIRKAEADIRTFITEMQDGYATTLSRSTMFRTSDNAQALVNGLRQQGFHLEVANLADGTFRIVHPKVLLDNFSSALDNLGANSGKTLSKSMRYNARQGVINIEKPSEAFLKQAGYGSSSGQFNYAQAVDEYYNVLSKEAEHLGLRADRFKNGQGLTIRSKQGTLAQYDKAEKALQARMSEHGFDVDLNTGLVRPKTGEAWNYGGTNGYQGTETVKVLVGENADEVTKRFRENAKREKMTVTENGNEVKASLDEALKECRDKAGKI